MSEPEDAVRARGSDVGDTGRVSIPRRLLLAIEPIKHELAKFGVVGSLSYALDSVVFAGMRLLTDAPYTPKIVAGVISMSAAFLGNRHWTWRHRPRSSLGAEYIRFVAVNAVGLLLQLACLYLTHDILGSQWPVLQTRTADFLSQGVFGMAIATSVRFWAYRRFVFRAHQPPTVAQPVAEPASSEQFAGQDAAREA